MEKLALLGGPKAAPYDYETLCNLPLVPDKAYKTINQMLIDGHISSGPVVKRFEKRFADYVEARYSLCTVNCTTAIHEALLAVGVTPGDEVLVPSYTFWATCAPILACGATPVFCDIDPATLNVDPEDIARRITPKSRVILIVHVWGCPCDMDAILAIARKHGLKVVEDCAHAHGALYKGKKVGTLGDVGCYSLQGSKTLPAGEGGILVTNDRTVYERCVSLGHYERLLSLPADSPYRAYFLTGLGFKHRVHPLGIAIADAHLDELDARNAVRDANGAHFDQGIADIRYLSAQRLVDGVRRVYSYHYVSYDRAAFGGVSTFTLLKALSAEGVVCGTCGYGRLHKAPAFTQALPMSDGFAPGGTHAARENPPLPITEDKAINTFMAAPRFETDCRQVIDAYVAAYHKVFAQQEALSAYEKEHPVLSEEPDSGRSINLFGA